jgi:hypothetical protein
MQKRQLKRLIDTGRYRPEPADIAQAMLRRRGVRELLIGGLAFAADGNGAGGAVNGNGGAPLDGAGKLPLNPADRIQSQSAVPRQAA